MSTVTERDLERLHQEMWSMDRRWRFIRAKPPENHALGRDVMNEARAILQDRGYRVSKAGSNDHHDLWCEGVRVEVKGSLWDEHQRRYQANLRRNEADVLLLGCVNGSTHWFVVPWAALADRAHVAVWSHDPEEYRGQWSRFYEAWSVVDELAENPPDNPWQLPLF